LARSGRAFFDVMMARRGKTRRKALWVQAQGESPTIFL